MRKVIAFLNIVLLVTSIGCSKIIECEAVYSVTFLRGVDAYHDYPNNIQAYNADTLINNFDIKIIYVFGFDGITPDCESAVIKNKLVTDETILTCDVNLIIEGDTIPSNTNIYYLFESTYPEDGYNDLLIYKTDIYPLPTFESSTMTIHIEVPLSDGKKISGAKKFVVLF
ncbi:MAG: hypothetical protein QM503_05765 [Bacteroidota bacterium]